MNVPGEKRKCKTLDQKVAMIKAVKARTEKSKVAGDFDVSTSTLSTILSKQKSIIDTIARRVKGNVKRMKTAAFEAVERAVKWFLDTWAVNLSERHGIVGRVVCGESQSVDNAEATKGLHHKTFQKHLKETFRKPEATALEKFYADSATAVMKTYKEMDPSFCKDITVVYDGTWHKRGHTSHIGVGSVIDFFTEVAKKEDDAAEPMEQGDEAEESENKVKTPAAVAAESQDAAKPAEKEKGAAFSSPVKSGSDKPGAEAHSPEKAVSEKPTPEKQSPEKTSSEKQNAEKASPEKVSPVKPSHEKLSVEKQSIEKPSPEKMSPAKLSVEKQSVEKSSPEKSSSERPELPKKPPIPENLSPIKVPTPVKQDTEKPSPVRPVYERTPLPKPSPEKLSSEKQPSFENKSGATNLSTANAASLEKAAPSPEKHSGAPVRSADMTTVPAETTRVHVPPVSVTIPPPQTPPAPKPTAPPPPAQAVATPTVGLGLPKENGDVGSEHGVFSVSWLDLVSDPNAERALRQARDVDVLALQGVEPGHWGVLTAQLPEGCELLKGTGLALVVRRSAFRVVEHSSHTLQSLIAKDLESLDEADREAVRNHLRLTPDGHLLTVRLQPLLSGQPTVDSQRYLVVANAALSPASPSVNALQVSTSSM
ncbi:hypothetical protein HPB51_012529 [Rhipicephalus microplus]|uniref:HTH psq-type domain-containing protein n=1 Tax=Rhipicephalus microplus TaxID=6941 RepID=A0A9J6DGV4_RHIMP|nr:hypothetical protein HPB51_012529 [Rhipicephalus microplus]